MSREKVREYARATGVGGEAVEADSGATVAPPTFAACFTIGRTDALFADPELGAHRNLVHGSQEYEFHRPVRVGDVLDCTPRIDDLRSRGTMDLLTLETRCVDARTGEPVLTSRSTIVFFRQEA